MTTLSKKQKKVLIGTLLGDGSLEFNGYKGVRLQIKQKKESKDYVFWMYDVFENFTRTEPKQRKDTNQWYFGTRYLRELKYFFDLFYGDDKKSVPNDIDNYLYDPLSLAVWFMDDGTLDYRPKSHYAYSLSTDSFSVSDVEKLKKTLKNNFNVESSIQTPRSRGTKYTKLYIGADGRDKFKNLIEDFILDCFSYKLPPKS